MTSKSLCFVFTAAVFSSIIISMAMETGASNTTQSTDVNLTTTRTTKKSCSDRSGCSQCTENSGCYWCEPDKKCQDYQTSKIIPRGCSGNKWFIGQCTIAGYIIIIVVPSLAGLFLIACGCCIYCKCCRQSNKSWKKEEDRITQRNKERQSRNEDKKADRKKRTDALRMKYGLLKSDDEEPLM